MTDTATVVATGRYLPERLVTNAELRERFASQDQGELIDRFADNSGIEQRYWAQSHQTTSDLAAEAATQALDRAGYSAGELDLIILGTDTPDHITPATSVVLQAKLGAQNAGTFDVSCACAAFPTALSIANGLIASNPTINRVLVVGAYLMHRLAAADDPMIFSTAMARERPLSSVNRPARALSPPRLMPMVTMPSTGASAPAVPLSPPVTPRSAPGARRSDSKPATHPNSMSGNGLSSCTNSVSAVTLRSMRSPSRCSPK
jgi:3-oxoacyl-[acyl-carrier-protein] synthase III